MVSLLAGLKKTDKKEDAKKKRRAYLDKFLSKAESHIKAPPASTVNTRKVIKKRIRTEEARGAQKATSKRRDRMLQLAKMPGNKGATELKRLRDKGAGKSTWDESRKRSAHNKDSGMKESEIDKKARARKEQLKAMPGGRGKMPSDKKIDSNAEKQEADRKRQAGTDQAAVKKRAEMEKKQKADAKVREEGKKQAKESTGANRKESQARAEKSKAAASKAAAKKTAEAKAAAAKKAAAEKAKKEAAARKAALAKKQAALQGKG